MSININIGLDPDNGPIEQQLRDAMRVLGYIPQTQVFLVGSDPAEQSQVPLTLNEEGFLGKVPTRKRGEPAPGKQRRTKAEIAEDDAKDAAEAAYAKAAAEARGNISTGGERVDPANADDAATAAQDKADEQAEVDANRDADAPLTIDDVKAAVTVYVEKYGLAFAQEDGPKIFVEALGNPPAGEAYWKFSILPLEDQGKIAKVIDTWKRAAAENPLKRTAV